LFKVGDQQTCAVHSEPPEKGERIYIQVVPGTIAEVYDREKFDNERS